MKQPIWTILVPSIPSRVGRYLLGLLAELVRQAEPFYPDVEVLSCIDNKIRSIGEKRNLMLHVAQGKFISMVDDDDEVTAIYVEKIVQALRQNPNTHLVTFKQQVVVTGPLGGECTVTFGLKNKNESMRKMYGRWVNIKRSPCQVCVWDKTIALSQPFPKSSYGEDYEWSRRVLPLVSGAVHLPDVLHRYFHDVRVSEAGG